MRYIILSLIISIAFTIPIKAEGKNRIPKSAQTKADIQRWMNDRAVKRILKASSIVICEPRADKNMVVTESLKGSAKVGQFWNTGLPRTKLLVCETPMVGDIGFVRGGVIEYTHYRIDERGNIFMHGDKGNRITTVSKVRELLKK